MATTRPTIIPHLTFLAAGANAEAQRVNLEAVQPSPGFPTATMLMADAIAKRAEIVVLDYTPDTVIVRYHVDGVWHTLPHMDREPGDYMLATLKKLADLDYRQRRARQEGQFVTVYMRREHPCRLITQGIKNGERAAIYIDHRIPPPETLDEMGMRPRMKQQLSEFLFQAQGMVLAAGMPGESLTSTWRGVLTAGDRFMRDYYAVEEQSRVEPEVINVTSWTFNEAAGESAFSGMRRLLLKQPNVICFPELPNGMTINQACDLVRDQELMVILRQPGKSCIDALLRALLLKPDVHRLAHTLDAVVCQRVVRKLCESCRQPFVPSPALLQKLGIPPGRIRHLYTHWRPPAPEPGKEDQPVEFEPCTDCGGFGYKGRTGIFELLVISDEFRKALVERPRLDHLTAIARSVGHLTIREEGIVLVARGTTSLDELQRVLNK